MVPYLTPAQADYLAALVRGEHGPDFWTDSSRQLMVDKLAALREWAIKEDAARERLRNR